MRKTDDAPSTLDGIRLNDDGAPRSVNLVVPSTATTSACHFFNSYASTMGVLSQLADLAAMADYTLHVARHALDGKKNPYKTPLELAQATPGRHITRLRRNTQVVLEMLTARLVDSFSTYASEIVRDALRAKPEMLRSQEQVRLDYVLSFSSLEELREDIVDRKVLDLSYLGFLDLERWCESRMGFPLANDDQERLELIEIIETRNVITHNRSIIGKKYLKNVKGTRFGLGDLRVIDFDYFEQVVRILFTVVARLDEKLADKYGLPRAPYSVPSEGGHDNHVGKTNAK